MKFSATIHNANTIIVNYWHV